MQDSPMLHTALDLEEETGRKRKTKEVAGAAVSDRMKQKSEVARCNLAVEITGIKGQHFAPGVGLGSGGGERFFCKVAIQRDKLQFESRVSSHTCMYYLISSTGLRTRQILSADLKRLQLSDAE